MFVKCNKLEYNQSIGVEEKAERAQLDIWENKLVDFVYEMKKRGGDEDVVNVYFKEAYERFKKN